MRIYMNNKGANTGWVKVPPKEQVILIAQGGVVGILAGLVIVIYRYALTYAEGGLFHILDVIKGNLPLTLLWFVALIAMACIVVGCLRFESTAGGSGLPQVAAELEGHMDAPWLRIILAKLVGAVTCIFGGLSLGRGGPSIQLGAMAAKGFARIRHYDRTKELHLLACGAGAGLAATFHAPIAGSLFLLEELRHTFDRTTLIAGVTAAITADFTARLFFGQAPIFTYEIATMPLQYYWLVAVLGIIMGLAGAGYNVSMLKAQALFKKLNFLPAPVKTAIPFLVAGGLGLALPQVLGGGRAMQLILQNQYPALTMLILLLVVKFLFSGLSFGSGVPGGVFFPLLILGSYLGAIFGNVSIQCLGLPENLWPNFIIMGMAGMFSGIIRTPMTAIVLIAEMTGSLNRLPDLAVVSILACVTANLTGNKPFCTSLLENTLKK